MKHLRLALLAPLLLAAGAAAPDPVRDLSGRYSSQFTAAMVDGHEYLGQNIVEIVPVAPNAAYARIHLDYANGHVCNIAGVARAEGVRLVYHDATAPLPGRAPCTLAIARAGRSLAIDDGRAATCSTYCGARGSLNGVSLPWASHRAITYLPRLRASREYRDALVEWRTGRPVR